MRMSLYLLQHTIENNLGTGTAKCSGPSDLQVFPLQHQSTSTTILASTTCRTLARHHYLGPPSTAPPTRTTAQRESSLANGTQVQLVSPGLPASACLPQASATSNHSQHQGKEFWSSCMTKGQSGVLGEAGWRICGKKRSYTRFPVLGYQQE